MHTELKYHKMAISRISSLGIKTGVQKFKKGSVNYLNTRTPLLMFTNSTGYAYSLDGGVTWTNSTLPVSSGINTYNNNVGFGNGLFVYAPYNTSVFYTSPDGITWTSRSLGASAFKSSVVLYGHRGFVVGTMYDSQRIATSTDGITWSVSSRTTAELPNVMVHAGYTRKNGRYIFPNHNDPYLFRTQNLSDFENRSDGIPSPYANPQGRYASNDQDLIGVNNGNVTQAWRFPAGYPQYGFLAKSVSLPAGTNNWNSVAWSRSLNKFIAPSADTRGAKSTDNGDSWSLLTFPTGFSGASITYASLYPRDPGFVMTSINAGANTKTGISADGETWTVYSNASINSWTLCSGQEV